MTISNLGKVIGGEGAGDVKYKAPFAVVCFLVLQLIFLSSDTALGDEPSFDCAKAATPVEKLICGSPELSDLDYALSWCYEDLRTVLNGRGKKSCNGAKLCG